MMQNNLDCIVATQSLKSLIPRLRNFLYAPAYLPQLIIVVCDVVVNSIAPSARRMRLTVDSGRSRKSQFKSGSTFDFDCRLVCCR